MRILLDHLESFPHKKIINTLKKILYSNVEIIPNVELNRKREELKSLKEKLAFFKLEMLKKYKEKNIEDLEFTRSELKKIDKVLNTDEIEIFDDMRSMDFDMEKIKELGDQIPEILTKIDRIRCVIEDECRKTEDEKENPIYNYFL